MVGCVKYWRDGKGSINSLWCSFDVILRHTTVAVVWGCVPLRMPVGFADHKSGHIRTHTGSQIEVS